VLKFRFVSDMDMQILLPWGTRTHPIVCRLSVQVGSVDGDYVFSPHFLGWLLFWDSDTYTECHRRNGPNFGRVFLTLNYTDITQNTYIQS